jgi:hypothetical protein
VWKQAWSTELPVEVSPGENTPAPVRTEVMLYHDEGALYVAFRAFDPEPSAIRAHLTDRDDAWSDDWVGVVLDTFPTSGATTCCSSTRSASRSTT